MLDLGGIVAGAEYSTLFTLRSRLQSPCTNVENLDATLGGDFGRPQQQRWIRGLFLLGLNEHSTLLPCPSPDLSLQDTDCPTLIVL